MRFRPLLALMLAFCLTFTTLPSSASAALKGREQGNARFGKGEGGEGRASVSTH